MSKKANNHLQRDHQRRKDRDMYNDFTALSKRKMHGVRMLTTEAIMQQLVKDYYLDEVTIMRRLKRYARTKNNDPEQLQMDLPEQG